MQQNKVEQRRVTGFYEKTIQATGDMILVAGRIDAKALEEINNFKAQHGDDVELVIVRNKFKTEEKHADWTMLIRQKYKRQESNNIF